MECKLCLLHNLHSIALAASVQFTDIASRDHGNGRHHIEEDIDDIVDVVGLVRSNKLCTENAKHMNCFDCCGTALQHWAE